MNIRWSSMTVRWTVAGAIVMMMSFFFTFVTVDQEREQEAEEQKTLVPDVEDQSDQSRAFSSMKNRFATAKANGQQVTQVVLDTSSTPYEGRWSISEVGDQAVILQDRDDEWVVKFEDLQVFQLGEPTPPQDR